MAPIFAQHRYGREDILAMLPKSTEPPDGLLKCQFFVEEVQLPIILSSLNETELVSFPFFSISLFIDFFFSACKTT